MGAPISETGEQLARLLRARAAALAAPIVDERPAEFVDLVVIASGESRYAFAAREAGEAIDLGEITPLPGVPAFYRGLISHRGAVYPVLDIGPLLGRRPLGDKLRHAILFGPEPASVAIAAEAIEPFVRMPASAIAAGASEGDGSVSAIRGLAPGGLVIVDTSVLLADARLVVDDRHTITDVHSGEAT